MRDLRSNEEEIGGVDVSTFSEPATPPEVLKVAEEALRAQEAERGEEMLRVAAETLEQLVHKFKQLRMLADAGFETVVHNLPPEDPRFEQAEKIYQAVVDLGNLIDLRFDTK